jgi:HPt (histidine-containing phosphotransfer) domain-containing protein
MERAAHSLKGSSGNLGAQCLQESCERMQYASRAEQLEISRSLAERIVRDFEAAKVALVELRDRLQAG